MEAGDLEPPPLFFTPDRIRHLQGLLTEPEYQGYFGDLEVQVDEHPLAEEDDYLSGAAGKRAFDLALLDVVFPGKGFGRQIPPILLHYADLYPLQQRFGRDKLYAVGLAASPDEEHAEAEAQWYQNILAAVEILGDCGAVDHKQKDELLEPFGRDPEYLKSVYVYTGLSPVWAERALQSAQHFKETGDRQSAQRALHLVEEYARWMRHFLTGEWFGRAGEQWRDSPGILFPESLAEAHFLQYIVLAYDLVRPHLARPEQRAIEDRVLRHVVETVFFDQDFHLPKNNHQWGHNAIIGMVGLCLGETRFIDYALHGRHGFHYHMKEAVNLDGYQYESCFGYHFGCLATYALLAEAALSSGGIDLYRHPQLRSLFEGPVHFFFHDLSYAPVGDTGTPVGEPDATRIVHWALDHGVNFVDTANIYEGYHRFLGSPGGVAETILGKALSGQRDLAVVATKVGNPVGPGAEDRGLARTHILRECDRSLARVNTDWIDMYYMHRTDPDTPIAESIEAFVDPVDVGKVRHWGLFNFDADETRGVLEACDDHGWVRPVVHQPPYSLLKRDIENGLLPLCRKEAIAAVPYQILQGGLLTGKYRGASAPPAGSRGAEKPDWLPMLEDPGIRQQIDALAEKAAAQGLSLFDYVIRTTARTPGITSILLGVKSPQQLAAAINALESA